MKSLIQKKLAFTRTSLNRVGETERCLELYDLSEALGSYSQGPSGVEQADSDQWSR